MGATREAGPKLQSAEVAEPGEAGGEAREREEEQGAAGEGANLGPCAVGEAGCGGFRPGEGEDDGPGKDHDYAGAQGHGQV